MLCFSSCYRCRWYAYFTVLIDLQVSIPSSGEKSSQLHSFPLASLADECEKFYELESSKAFDDYAGNYFVLATVFPSSKVCLATILFV